MSGDDVLNTFQTKCEVKLIEALVLSGFRIDGRYVDYIAGNPHIHGHVLGTGLEFWIYVDGINYQGGIKHKNRHYERLDVRDLYELQDTFVHDFIAECVEVRRRLGE